MSRAHSQQDLFEQAILPHLDAAFNLARWILNNDQDAEDLVQEAYLRAFKYFPSYQGGSSRAWLLTIVRNVCYTWLHQNRAREIELELKEELSSEAIAAGAPEAANPESFLEMQTDHQRVARALEKLPAGYRELIVLREMEGMSYKEIALIGGIPIGTVMSRLARARQRLKECLSQREDGDAAHGL